QECTGAGEWPRQRDRDRRWKCAEFRGAFGWHRDGLGVHGFGQLGIGSSRVDVARSPLPIPDLANVTAIASAGEHALALPADGTVMSWGTNDFGQLGDGTFNDRFSPVSVLGLSNVAAIACGGEPGVALRSTSLALIGDGTIMAWGGDARSPSSTPVQVPGLN